MKKQHPSKKKRPRALRKTEIGVDVVSIEKFKKHKRPDLFKSKRVIYAFCQDPDFPDEAMPVNGFNGEHMVILPWGSSIDDFDLSEWDHTTWGDS